MKQEQIPSRHGYPIPIHNQYAGQDQVVVVCHGFGSSKSSPMVQALHETLPKRGIGVVAFDFPSHGESPVWQEGLRVPYCIDDLEAVEAHVRALAPQAQVSYFGSSFGAYITLLRLARHPRPAAKAFLRSAAVTMPRLVEQWATPEARAILEKQGYFVPDWDYVREMRITQAFLDDLKAHDVFSAFRPGMAQIAMVHGALDDVAPAADARRFAQAVGARLLELPRGEHPLMGAGELDQVLEAALSFFLGEGCA